MKTDTELSAQSVAAQDIAASFVAARSGGRVLAAYPGDIPPDLEAAYRIQDHAIDLWPDAIGGWKVGRIPLNLDAGLGIDRLAGPIFAKTIRETSGDDVIQTPVFDGGFAAIEAEYVAVIRSDAPADKTVWSTDEARDMIADLRIGLEIASSPLATINEL